MLLPPGFESARVTGARFTGLEGLPLGTLPLNNFVLILYPGFWSGCRIYFEMSICSNSSAFYAFSPSQVSRLLQASSSGIGSESDSESFEVW